MAVTARLLSGSTNGRPIKVAATSIGSGTTVHTATTETAADKFDEITLYATNTDTSDRPLTVGWGGTTDPDDLVLKAVTIPASSGPVAVVTGLRLNNGLVVRAACTTTANVILITGVVIRSV
jgi:hypothetical protein